MSGSGELGLGRTLAERGVDTNVPNVARIYDFLLGGKNHFQADRDAAEEIERQIPYSALACRQNRDFLGRVVRYLTASGIRQFLDIGSGLPGPRSVHELAQAAAPDTRVVYVDYDPMAVIHSQVLLADKSGRKRTAAVQADLRDLESITGNPIARPDRLHPARHRPPARGPALHP